MAELQALMMVQAAVMALVEEAVKGCLARWLGTEFPGAWTLLAVIS